MDILKDKSYYNTAIEPVLIIGLGGMGTETLASLKAKIEDNKIVYKNTNLKFLAIDTDENIRKVERNKHKLDTNELVLLSDTNIDELLEDKSYLPSYVSSWINLELYLVDGLNGTSGTRQAGRLLLFRNIAKVRAAIDNKLDLLIRSENVNVNVIILGSASGGTSGGIFIDIPYIVRELANSKLSSKAKVNILGYIYTPDVNLLNPMLGIAAKNNIRRNGYIALTELDEYMRGKDFSQQYSGDYKIVSNEKPYDACHLVSAMNNRTTNLRAKYKKVVDTVTESIIHLLLQSGNELYVTSYMKYLEASKESIDEPYSMLGISTLKLPTEQINTEICYRFYNNFIEQNDKMPDSNTISDILEYCHLTEEEVDGVLDEIIPDLINDFDYDSYTYNNVISKRNNKLDKDLEEQVTAPTQKNISIRANEIAEDALSLLEEKLSELCIKYSPRYVMALINDTNGMLFDALDNYIALVGDELERYVPSDLKETQDELDMLYAEARETIVNKYEKKNEYIECKLNSSMLSLKYYKYQAIIKLYREIKEQIVMVLDRTYIPIIDGLNEIKKNVDKQMKESHIEYEYSDCFKLINLADMRTELDNKLSDTPNLIHEFYKELLESKIQSDTGNMGYKAKGALLEYEAAATYIEEVPEEKENAWNPIEVYENFILEKFKDIRFGSIEDFLGIGVGYNSKQEDNIIKHLFNSSVSAISDGEHHIYYSNIFIPRKCSNMQRRIAEICKANSRDNNRFIISTSDLSEEIYWETAVNNVALSEYTTIERLKKMYYESDEKINLF